jgi:hypothetical protein
MIKTLNTQSDRIEKRYQAGDRVTLLNSFSGLEVIFLYPMILILSIFF